MDDKEQKPELTEEQKAFLEDVRAKLLEAEKSSKKPLEEVIRKLRKEFGLAEDKTS